MLCEIENTQKNSTANKCFLTHSILYGHSQAAPQNMSSTSSALEDRLHNSHHQFAWSSM